MRKFFTKNAGAPNRLRNEGIMRKPTRSPTHLLSIMHAYMLQRNVRRTAYLRHLSYQVGPALDQIDQFSQTDWCLCERCHTKWLRKFIGLHACDSILILYGPLKIEETNLKTFNLIVLTSHQCVKKTMNHFFFFFYFIQKTAGLQRFQAAVYTAMQTDYMMGKN